MATFARLESPSTALTLEANDAGRCAALEAAKKLPLAAEWKRSKPVCSALESWLEEPVSVHQEPVGGHRGDREIVGGRPAADGVDGGRRGRELRVELGRRQRGVRLGDERIERALRCAAASVSVTDMRDAL